MSIYQRIGWRLLAGIVVLWGAVSLSFIGLHFASGDPALVILGGPEALPTPEVLARVREQYGLDQPLWVQYGHYLSRLLVGDLGESYRLQIPVTQAIATQLGATLQLALAAAVLALLLAISVALLTARRGRWLSASVSGVELVLSSTPIFVLSMLLLLLFSFTLHWLPPTGSGGWRNLILPSLTLALPVAALLIQVLRQELDDILEQPFITMARARGLSEAGVRVGHALRHALIPLLTLAGFIFASLLAGSVVVETLFSRQGIGRLLLDAVTNKDVPMVLGITLLAALSYVLINLLVDLLLPWIDPRVQGQ
ncbi:ABC transporter permease [Pseudomonas sp. 5P_3.1_Bac2]|uniref:ABC transporter permease n=1 Tax=Pseudomonas sp. 5P_3.1_Bac2 TaxID=2971617 RepID=UPI0021C710AC|nr:ABC transporter permease [Pseudomonas sp. 5P_3.1_Bac2]MCU1717233.1 ABC transporter permease [Pseudomonas sp. 5P_3.1_Bac2]